MPTACPRGRARAMRRIFTALTLAAFILTTTGCATWQVQPLAKMSYPDYTLVRQDARFHLNDGRVVTMQVVEVDYPLVRGIAKWDELSADKTTPAPGRPLLEVDCRDVTKLEISRTHKAAAIAAVVTGVAVVAILIAVAASNDDQHTSSSSQSSCPVLYVRDGDGDRLVGEPYAGAAAKSVRRRDLLPLPDLAGADPVRLRLANEARETQYTDTARLLVVDHAPGTRVVATNDQEPLAVGAAASALTAVALDGTDVAPLVAGADSLQWQTDLSACVDRPDFPLTEGVEATFAPPAAGARPVLELTLGNTYWLDLVMNRFLALLGDRFATGMERAGRDSAGPRLRAWLTREGVDLTVAVKAADGWREVGSVRPAGPLALRQVAVPLPTDVATDSPLTVRVSGGSGFWRIDRLALSTTDDSPLTCRRLAPVSATDGTGADQRDLLAADDDRCQALAGIGDALDLSFAPPPVAPGLVRSAFFEAGGYYVAHQPRQAVRSLATFRTITDEPGALARFSLDLYRGYCELARRAGPAGGSS